MKTVVVHIHIHTHTHNQRPGAIVGMKLDEAYARRMVEVEGRQIVTIKVSEHNTGTSERAD